LPRCAVVIYRIPYEGSDLVQVIIPSEKEFNELCTVGHGDQPLQSELGDESLFGCVSELVDSMWSQADMARFIRKPK
jgi:hypothetical protein